jgi:hypothetical protein
MVLSRWICITLMSLKAGSALPDCRTSGPNLCQPEGIICVLLRLIGNLVGAEIWDTLKAVTSDLSNPSNSLILESAGIIVHGNDLRTSYDERGQDTPSPQTRFRLRNFVTCSANSLITMRLLCLE